jgi:hypothetical protein
MLFLGFLGLVVSQHSTTIGPDGTQQPHQKTDSMLNRGKLLVEQVRDDPSNAEIKNAILDLSEALQKANQGGAALGITRMLASVAIDDQIAQVEFARLLYSRELSSSFSSFSCFCLLRRRFFPVLLFWVGI